MKPGDLVRIVHVAAEPLWTRRLVGKVGVVLVHEWVGFGNRVFEVMVEGKIHRLHPLDVERI